MATKKKALKKSKLRHAEYYDFQKIQDKLYAESMDGKMFTKLVEIITLPENIKLAYRNIKKNKGSKTAGTDGKTIQHLEKLSEEKLVVLVQRKFSWYVPQSVRRVEIPKDNGKTRPLGIPTIMDRLVQQCVLQVLEPICEAKFHDHSYGFRPNRSQQHAISQVHKNMQLSHLHYVVDIDIKGFFDNVSHGKLLKQLWTLGICDKKLISIISAMLKAEVAGIGFPEKGTPQGGIVSPILANIYLDKFDKYIREYINRFNKGVTRKGDARYKLYEQRRYRLAKKLKNEKDVKVRKQMTAEIKRLREERNNYPARNEMDSSIKRLKYVRYADDFLIGVIGSLEDCKTVKEDIKNYLKEALKLELSDEKTLITNAQKPAKFLGFDIFIRRSNDLRKDINGKTIRSLGHVPVLYLNYETMRKKLFDYKAARIAVENGKEIWKSIVRTYMIDLDDLEIVSQFNAEIRGFYNYYSIANNSPAINSFYHIMSYSMYKTFARKYKSSVKKILFQYKKDGTFKVAYENSKGKTLYQSFYHDGFKRKKIAGATSCDTIPRTVTITGGRNSLMERLKLQVCELCGATDKLEMHHVRKLKDLKGKSDWEKNMIARRRKTLAVCSKCHAKIDPDRRIRLN